MHSKFASNLFISQVWFDSLKHIVSDESPLNNAWMLSLSLPCYYHVIIMLLLLFPFS